MAVEFAEGSSFEQLLAKHPNSERANAAPLNSSGPSSEVQTPEALRIALIEVLPRLRLNCQPEQTYTKATIYHDLKAIYVGLIETRPKGYSIEWTYRYTALLDLFTQLLLEESFNASDLPEVQSAGDQDEEIVCSYCACQIWNRFLTCKICAEDTTDTQHQQPLVYDLCLDCYAMGRSCRHISGLTFAEQIPWQELMDQHNAFVKLKRTFGHTSRIDLSFARLRAGLPIKTIAEVCQEQLRKRPFNNAPVEILNASTPWSIADIYPQACRPCHHCHIVFPLWQLATCTRCDEKFCYQDLYDLYEFSPVEVLKDKSWQCPHCWHLCLGELCKTSQKTTRGSQRPMLVYLAGLNTDPRSVQVLVNFYSRSHGEKPSKSFEAADPPRHPVALTVCADSIAANSKIATAPRQLRRPRHRYGDCEDHSSDYVPSSRSRSSSSSTGSCPELMSDIDSCLSIADSDPSSITSTSQSQTQLVSSLQSIRQFGVQLYLQEQASMSVMHGLMSLSRQGQLSESSQSWNGIHSTVGSRVGQPAAIEQENTTPIPVPLPSRQRSNDVAGRPVLSALQQIRKYAAMVFKKNTRNAPELEDRLAATHKHAQYPEIDRSSQEMANLSMFDRPSPIDVRRMVMKRRSGVNRDAQQRGRAPLTEVSQNIQHPREGYAHSNKRIRLV